MKAKETKQRKEHTGKNTEEIKQRKESKGNKAKET